MITIIHGDDTAQSRGYFLELKKKQKDPASYDGGKVTLTDLVQDIEGAGLFADSKTVFLENFLSKNKKSDTNTKEIIKFITKNSKNSSFILWESKEITKRDLFIFKDAAVKVFKLPKSMFAFLDNLKPGNSRALLNLFHSLIESDTSEELVLFMMQRQFRLLLALYDPSDNQGIDEVLRLAPWQKNKLENQTNLFKDLDELKGLYKKLYEMELKRKTGALRLSLIQSIDIFLLKM